MKKIIFTTLLTLFFCCCDDSNDPKTDIEIDTIKSKEYLWVGHEKYVEIKTILSNPTVEIENTDIVQAEIKNNYLHIQSIKKGATDLLISDKTHNKKRLTIVVGSLVGKWKEGEFGALSYNVKIEASNQDRIPELIDLIQNQLKLNLGAPYLFKDDGSFTMQQAVNSNNIVDFSGTYEHQEDLKLLLLKYNNLIDTYNITPLSYFLIKLEQDLTKNYQEKYPNDGIKQVLITKYLVKPENP